MDFANRPFFGYHIRKEMGEMGESDQQSLPAAKPRKRFWTIMLLASAVVALLGAGAAGGILLAKRPSKASIAVPSHIAANLDFTAWLPEKLPGSYAIDPSSFHTAEDANVLLFQARDSTGATLDFSEQRRPGKDFDFDRFYSEQIKDFRRLAENDQMQAVWGRSGDGRTTLSIVKSNIWILMVTSSSLDEPSLQQIADDPSGP